MGLEREEREKNEGNLAQMGGVGRTEIRGAELGDIRNKEENEKKDYRKESRDIFLARSRGETQRARMGRKEEERKENQTLSI